MWTLPRLDRSFNNSFGWWSVCWSNWGDVWEGRWPHWEVCGFYGRRRRHALKKKSGPSTKEKRGLDRQRT